VYLFIYDGLEEQNIEVKIDHAKRVMQSKFGKKK
jgi:hypothetical protein